MSFKQLLGRRQIKKKVDEGMGDTPLVRIPEVQALYQETPTTFSQLTEDLVSAATEVAKLAMDTITELENTFQDVPVFAALAQELRSSAFDPTLLDQNPDYVPPVNLSTSQMASLQQQVYEQMSDPRAPFLWDLWNIFQELTITIWAVRKGWRSLEDVVNKLFGVKLKTGENVHLPQPEPTNSLRRAHFMDLERVRRLKFEVERIKHKAHQQLSKTFMDTMGLTLADYQLNPNTESVESILNIMELLLKDQLLELSDDHQRFMNSVNGHYGEWRDYASQKLSLLLPHSVLSSTMNPIINFTLLLDQIGDREDLQVQDFRQQLETALYTHTLKVEEDMLAREGAAIDHARDLLHSNVEKAGLLKQYIESVRAGQHLSQGQALGAHDLTDVGTQAKKFSDSIKSAVRSFHSSKVTDFLSVVSNVQRLLDSIGIGKRP